MRSSCRRSIITMSAPFRPVLHVGERLRRRSGRHRRAASVRGATSRTRAPIIASRRMLERATRLCSTSPQIATIRPSKLPQPAADGQRVQQRLGGMLMGAVAGIDHAAVQLARQQFGRARILMAHHQDVGPHGVQGGGGVDQGLALGDGRGLDAHVHHIGAQPLAGQLEAGLGAGRGFEEQVDQGAARAAARSSCRRRGPGAT